MGIATSAYGRITAVNVGHAQKDRNDAARENDVSGADISLMYEISDRRQSSCIRPWLQV